MWALARLLLQLPFALAFDLWDLTGRAGKSAKLANELAEMFDANGESESAIEWYTRAADYYQSEGSIATASQCKIKVRVSRAPGL